jgi:hypothetical protein
MPEGFDNRSRRALSKKMLSCKECGCELDIPLDYVSTMKSALSEIDKAKRKVQRANRLFQRISRRQ